MWFSERNGFHGRRSRARMSAQPSLPEKIMKGVTVVDHPLVQHKLTIMRNKETSTAGFRRLLREISLLLGYEVTRDLQLTTTRIETPLEAMDAPTIEGKKLVFASVLRAGNGLLEGLLDLVPAARVAHIGLYRDHDTLEAVEYFFKAPSDLADRLVIVVDPMLATANSAIAAIDKLKGRGATNLRYLCLLAAPEGIARFTRAHPDVPVFTAAIDRHLNEKGYIVPGLGDAGDRMYGTK
jgi:uracil phosphoribosyltransferase